MTEDQLIQEGRKLARPCVYLRDKGEAHQYAAIWRGTGVVPHSQGPYRHWLTIDCHFLIDSVAGSTGCLSVYTNEDDCQSGIVAIDPQRHLSTFTHGTRLFALPGETLPPIEAVFKFGSSAVREWLDANNWDPDWGYSDNFKDRQPADVYQRTYQAQCPLYSGNAYAVLGGWHFPWPDNDWEQLLQDRLIAWTFEESEPWVEVWEQNRAFRVIQRIT